MARSTSSRPPQQGARSGLIWRDNDVTVVFGATTADADNINQAYHRFHSENVGIEDVLRQQSNVVMLWHAHPSDADLNRVTACLK